MPLNLLPLLNFTKERPEIPIIEIIKETVIDPQTFYKGVLVGFGLGFGVGVAMLYWSNRTKETSSE